jgi:hypothetical protein
MFSVLGEGGDMGANFQTMRLPLDKVKAADLFRQEQEPDRYDNGHSYSGGFGMTTGLEFAKQTFTDETTATDWLEGLASAWCSL